MMRSCATRLARLEARIFSGMAKSRAALRFVHRRVLATEIEPWKFADDGDAPYDGSHARLHS